MRRAWPRRGAAARCRRRCRRRSRSGPPSQLRDRAHAAPREREHHVRRRRFAEVAPHPRRELYVQRMQRGRRGGGCCGSGCFGCFCGGCGFCRRSRHGRRRSSVNFGPRGGATVLGRWRGCSSPDGRGRPAALRLGRGPSPPASAAASIVVRGWAEHRGRRRVRRPGTLV
jgi:hypothetical protein